MAPLRVAALRRSFAALAVLVCLPTAGSVLRLHAQAPAAALQLVLQVNQPLLAPGATLRVDVGAINGPTAVTADFLWGVILPGGGTALQLTSGGLSTANPGNVGTLRPLFSRLTVPAGFAQTIPNFFTYAVNGSEPVGAYRLYFAAIRPGAFQDGRIDAGDVLAVEFRDFTIGPAATATVDTSRSGTATISPLQGGTVQATAAGGAAYALRVPAGALFQPTTITLTPATLPNPPGGGRVLGALRAEPSGLRFLVPGTVQVTVPGGIPAGPLSALVTAPGGGFEALPAIRTGATTALIVGVTHFSDFALVSDGSFFANTGRIAAGYLPRLQAAVDRGIDGTITIAQAQAEVDATVQSWEFALNLLLPASRTRGLSEATRFAQTFEYMENAFVLDRFRQAFPGLFSADTQAAFYHDLITKGPLTRVRELADDLDARCRQTQNLAAAEDYARTVMMAFFYAGSVRTDAAFITPLDPNEFQLDFTTRMTAPRLCVVPQIVDATWPTAPTVGQPATLRVRAGLSFAGAAPVFQAGLDVNVTAQQVTPATARGDTDGAGSFSRVFTPTSVQHRFDIDVQYPFGTGNGNRALILGTNPTRASIVRSQVTGVTVTPPQTTVQRGASQQFTATVSGTANQNVTWAISGSALGSTLSQSGLFTAGQTAGTVFVTATSVADPSAVGVAQVTIEAALLCASGCDYNGTFQVCVQFESGEVCNPPSAPDPSFTHSRLRLSSATAGTLTSLVGFASFSNNSACAFNTVYDLVISGTAFTGTPTADMVSRCGVPPTATVSGTFSAGSLRFLQVLPAAFPPRFPDPMTYEFIGTR